MKNCIKSTLGKTKTINDKPIGKDDCLIEINGTIDALQSQIDKVCYGLEIIPDYAYHSIVNQEIQVLLCKLGGEVSGIKLDLSDENIIDNGWVQVLEQNIDELSLKLTGFQRFKNPIAIDINEARIRTRELERKYTKFVRGRTTRTIIPKFINRLSSYYFALSVAIEKKYG